MPLHQVVVIPSVAAAPGKRIRGNDWIRFWSKVDRTAGPTACWPWTGPPNDDGYGNFTVKEGSRFRGRLAHRWLVEQMLGRQLDPKRGTEDACHWCNNRICCNPLHLYVDSRSGNMRYAVESGRHHQSSKTHCPAEHEYTEANTYTKPNGERACRQCRTDRLGRDGRARKDRQTHCKNNHELSGDNLKIVKGGRRKCLKCEAARIEKSVAGRKNQVALNRVTVTASW